MLKTTIVVFLIVVCLLIAECTATPIYGTVTMSPAGFGAKDTMKVWGGGHTGLDVYAGVYMFNKTAGSGQGQLFDNGYIGGLCMDLSEYIAPGSSTYDVIMPQDASRPTAEAFAAAVWEIVYEDLPASLAQWDVTTDSTGGDRGFKAENLDYLTANDRLHSLDGTGETAQLRSLSYIGSQDMLVAVPPGAIPEPATIILLTVGGMGMIISLRNKRK